jgi:hypothetical protein
MAGMARRGSHSARHRVGRGRSDALGSLGGPAQAATREADPAHRAPALGGPADPALGRPAGTDPTDAKAPGGLVPAGTGRAGARSIAGLEPVAAAGAGAVTEAEPEAGRGARAPGRRAAAPRKLGRPMGLAIKTISLACAAAVVVVAGMISVGPTGASVAASVKTFLYDWETGN